jgi:hypothetical protein
MRNFGCPSIASEEGLRTFSPFPVRQATLSMQELSEAFLRFSSKRQDASTFSENVNSEGNVVKPMWTVLR